MTPFRERYRDSNLALRAREVLVRGSTRSTTFIEPGPPYAQSAHGCVVRDHLGHEVIDLNNNYTSLIHGHGFEPAAQAVAPLLEEGTAFGLPTEPEISLAEHLAARTGYPRWRFCNSGTEAVSMALRATRAATGRDIVIRFEGSYHGLSDWASDGPGVPSGSWRGRLGRDVQRQPGDDDGGIGRATGVHVAGERLQRDLVDLDVDRCRTRTVVA